MALAAKGGEQGVAVGANIGSGCQFKVAGRTLEKERRVAVRTDFIVFVNQLTAATTKCCAALQAMTIFDVKHRAANRALAGVCFFRFKFRFDGEADTERRPRVACWHGRFLNLIFLFQRRPAMRANYRIGIDLLVTKGAENGKFCAAARARNIVSVDGGAAGWAEFLPTFEALGGVMGNNGVAGWAAS